MNTNYNLTQAEKIKKAKRAYVLQISARSAYSMTDRYQIYIDGGNGLEVLWPLDCHEGSRAKDLLPYQKHSSCKNFPAFHFVIRGCGFSKLQELRDDLQKINPEIEVFKIDGISPSWR